MDWKRYRKLIVAAVIGAVAVADQLWGPGNAVSSTVIALATVFGVYSVPNAPPKR